MSDLQILTLDHLFNKITEGLLNGETLDSMEHFVESYSGDDWTSHVSYSDEKYCRKRVFRNDQAELIVISWKQSQKTPIHDHPVGGCIMKVLVGLLCEDKYSENADIHLNTTCLEEGSISYSSGKQVLHQISAMSNTVSVHIYAPPNYVPTIYL